MFPDPDLALFSPPPEPGIYAGFLFRLLLALGAGLTMAALL